MECVLPDFYTEKLVKARKPHRCCETGRVIDKGERYWRCEGKWDGVVSTQCQCESAYHFARALNSRHKAAADYYDGCVVPFGGVTEDVSMYSEGHPIHDLWDAICRGERTFGPDDKIPTEGTSS